MLTRTTLLIGGLVLALTTSLAATLSPQQADAFQQKLRRILAHGASAGRTAQRTEITSDELSAALQSPGQLPAGVADPAVTLLGGGRMSGRATVDLDAIRKKQSNGNWFDPSSYLTGSLPVNAVGTLVTQGGYGQFQLERADVSGVPIPKSLLQEIVSYYTKSADLPDGVNLDQRFELPAKITRIDIEVGRAIVLQ